jgi:branched-chain amino acid aminotransferase
VKVEERDVTVAEVVEAASKGTLKEAFGVGTAATIAHISHFGFEEEVFELGPIQDRKFSNKVLETLDQIKTGQIEDKFGWTRKV